MIELKPVARNIVVSRELLDAAKSVRGGWSREQLAILGVAWPPKPKWKNSLINQARISTDERDRLLQLRVAR